MFSYIHGLSNHPPNVIEQIPNSIQERLSKNSSNEEIFNIATCECKDGFKVGSNLILNILKSTTKTRK